MHSKVFVDEGFYSVLVAHDVPVSSPEGFGLTGLLEYAVDSEGGDLMIYDPDEDEIYTVDENWSGLNGDAVKDLIVAGESGVASEVDEEFYRIRDAYRANPWDAEGALKGGFPVGTVVLISDYDVMIKRSDNSWEATGQYIQWTDEMIEHENYEVLR